MRGRKRREINSRGEEGEERTGYVKVSRGGESWCGWVDDVE
jgi:hypothetical protein